VGLEENQVASATKSERIELRVSAKQKETFARAAEARGETMTDFINDAASAAAEEALASRTSFALSSKQWTAFVAALDRPPQQKKRLAKLLKKKSVLE
jgi:uncharacterized protein (DUF1778 family)